MKKIFLIALILVSISAFGQPVITQYIGSPKTQLYNRGWLSSDSGILNSLKDTILAPVRLGEQRFRTQDSTLYIANSVVVGAKRWSQVGTGAAGGGQTIFSDVTSLRASTAYSTTGIILLGLNNKNDNGGGNFYWDASSSATDDGTTIIKPTNIGGGNGRFLRVFSGTVTMRQVNIIGDGTDQKTKINNAFSNATVQTLVLDSANAAIKFTGKIFVPTGKAIRFENGAYLKGGSSLTDTIENFIVDAPYSTKIFDTTITVREIVSARGAISVAWFGAKADCLNTNEVGTTDNFLPFRRAIIAMFDSLQTGNGYYYTRRLYIPAGRKNNTYYISNTLYIGGSIEIFGDGITTIVNWPRGVAGIVITNTSYGNTAQFANPQGQAAYRCSIHDLTLSGYKGNLGFFAGYYDAVSHGISLYAGSANLQRLQVMNWLGDGIHVFGANESYFADVETDYCAGNGFNFLTADGNANALYRCVARWSGKYGFHDVSFLGNFAYNCNATTNGGHYSFNRTAITDGGKFWYAKRSVIWRVYHNGHHYTCILAHNSGAVDAEPGVGSVWATYWTDNGVGSYNNQWINWEQFEDYNVGFVHPGVTSGWQNYYDSTIDFTWANNVWNDSTQYVGGGGYYLEGGNQTGSWTGLYSEFDQITGYNNSTSFVAFGNGGAVILGQNQNGWSQKWNNGFMMFPNVAAVSQNNQANPNNERWWAVIKGSTGISASQKTFGWYNSQTGNVYGWDFDTTANNIILHPGTGLSLTSLSVTSITNSGTYTGNGGRMTITQLGQDWNESTPGTTGGSIHLYPLNTSNFGSAITFGAPSSGVATNAQAGIYTRMTGSGSKMYLTTTNNYTIGSQTHLFIDATGRVSLGTSPQFTPTAELHLPAGTATASTAPLKFTTSGAVLLTTPEAGVAEPDANGILYYTPEATAGRGYVPDVQRFRLTANGGNISTISNFFGSTSNPTLVSGAEYIIEIDMYYTNTTAGTVTFTFTNSAAPTSQNIHARFSPLAGIVAPAGSAAATYLEGDIQGDATGTLALTTTGTLTDATTQWAHFSIHLYNGTGTSLKIQATKLVGGTITPLKGSYWTVTRVPAGNTGIFNN